MEDRFAMAADAPEKRTGAGYDCWTASYDDGDPSTWLDEPFLLDQLKPFPGCRILDLGCGTGRYLRRLACLTESERTSGHLHEVRDLIVAAQDAKLTIECIEEPVMTEAMVPQRSSWRHKLDCPTLLLLALSK
ncbi:MAG: hypothetical protein KF722_09790 [Nitrospira sp.]|nr:hypothetical protein [Nitrospira sp.]